MIISSLRIKAGYSVHVAFAVCVVSLVCACNSPAKSAGNATNTSANPSPTTTFQPQVTIFEPTITASPTAEPTNTAVPATETPAATSTPSPDQINPFTGLVITDTSVLNRRPLLIKVANTYEVRPQSGLALADVVVEHYTEGGITRFSALYLTNSPQKVGSVRSCRLIDLELPAIFGSSLTCSGSSAGVRALLLRSTYLFDHDSNPNDSLAIESDFGPFECPTCVMFRTSDKPAPHNLFANTPLIWKELDRRGKNTRTKFNTWTFDSIPITTGQEVSQVALPYLVDSVLWQYDSATMSWLRFTDGISHTDATTHQQLSASNVVVAYVPHVYTSIIEDVNGARSIRIELWGQGPVRVYRDGRMIKGTWERAEGSTYSLFFKDTAGTNIALRPGNTWIELVPPNFVVKDR